MRLQATLVNIGHLPVATTRHSHGPLAVNGIVAWTGFGVGIVGLLLVDLLVVHRQAHKVRIREALFWSAVWIVLALLFAGGVFLVRGTASGVEFLTAYVIEKSLSIDNLFVFAAVFRHFRVPCKHQHRVLFWGVLGALVLRGVFIFTGIALIERFTWMIYVFAALLLWAAIKMLTQGDDSVDPEHSRLLRYFRKLVPMTPGFVEGQLLVRVDGRLLATPLLAVLVFIEASDVLFAIDSIPAVLAVSTDPFIVYTSNVFAILGLRSLYHALAAFLGRFRYLHHALAAILAFVAAKMGLAAWVHVPPWVSLGVVSVLLVMGVLASLWLPDPKRPRR